MGPRDVPRWLFADVDLAAIERVRREGQVLGHRDWPEQERDVAVEQAKLGSAIGRPCSRSARSLL
jgi:hypothetical protein